MPEIEGLEHKQLSSDSPAVGLTEVKEDGVVEAFVSVTGIVDNVNDIIVPGAYTKTLQERTPKGVWSHDWNTPVSKALAVEEYMPGDSRLPKTLANGEKWPDEAGALYVKAQFNLGTTRGRDAFSDVVFYKDQAEWSIGYNVPKGKAEKDAKGTRLIKELNLYEFSPVLFGAASNARSLITSAKALFDSEEEFMAEVKNVVEHLDGVTVHTETAADEAEAAEIEAEVVPDEPEVVEEVSEEEHTCDCGHDEEEKTAKSEVRAEDIDIPLTAESIAQIKTLYDQLGTVLSLISVKAEPVVEEVTFPENKGMRESMDALIEGSGDSGIIQAIDDNIRDLEAAIKVMDTNAIHDNANDALDEITFALQDPKTDDQTKSDLKALVAAIGEAIAEIENGEVETEIAPEPVATTKAITMSATEWKKFLEI